MSLLNIEGLRLYWFTPHSYKEEFLDNFDLEKHFEMYS